MALNIYENTTMINKAIQKENINIKRIVYSIVKRTIDIVGGLVGIILLIPITIIIFIFSLFNKKEDKGPVFFTQRRIGKDGKQFKLYKYRSMVINADEILWEYLEENEEAKKEYIKYKKLKKDPRITRIGEFLRKTNIDEFPQFINVLKGDMSLVGPRPYLYREKDDMEDSFSEIIKVKPGITGFWQIDRNKEVDFKGRTIMDIEYIQKRSLWIDIKILIKTILKMFIKVDMKTIERS